MPIVIKRLDARYDWLDRFGQGSYQLVDAGDGCEPAVGVAGRVAWVSDAGNCTFFTKVWAPTFWLEHSDTPHTVSDEDG